MLDQKILDQILYWFLFNVAVALLPIGANAARIYLKTRTLPKLIEIFSDGDLLLVSVGINADAFGGLLLIGNRGFLTTVSSGVCILLMAGACFIFPMVKEIAASKSSPVGSSEATNLSIILFIISFLFSAFSKFLTTLK